MKFQEANAWAKKAIAEKKMVKIVFINEERVPIVGWFIEDEEMEKKEMLRFVSRSNDIEYFATLDKRIGKIHVPSTYKNIILLDGQDKIF